MVVSTPKRGAQLFQNPAVGAEQGLPGQDVVAGADQAHQRQMYRRHARGLGATGLGALEQGQPVFEHFHGRVGVARIDEALGAGEPRVGALGGVVEIALGQEDRLGRLAKLRTQRAAAHQPRGDLPIGGIVGGFSWP